MLDKIGFQNLDNLLNSYSKFRIPDTFAICDLAVANYAEVFLCYETKSKKLIDYTLQKLDEVFGDHQEV